MDKAEIVKLREFLRRSFGAPALQVTPNSKSAEAADVSLGERKIGEIAVDDEDGDRSFSFAMKVPVGRPDPAGLPAEAVRERQADGPGRLKKTNSVELNNGPDFLGVVSADDPKGIEFHTADGDPRHRSRRRVNRARARGRRPEEIQAMPLYSLEGSQS